LPTMKLKLSLFKDTNDPREYKERFFGFIGFSYLPSVREAKKLSKKINQIIRNEYRVACFCSNYPPIMILENRKDLEDPHATREGWNKSRMWSQYGDNHAGACVVFSKRSLKEIFSHECTSDQLYSYERVSYLQNYEIHHESLTLNGDRLANEGEEKYLKDFISSNFDHIYFEKHIDYRDEAEYRVVIHDPLSKLETINIKTALKGVIWGDKISEVVLPCLHKECNRLSIDCIHLKWEQGRPLPLLCA